MGVYRGAWPHAGCFIIGQTDLGLSATVSRMPRLGCGAETLSLTCMGVRDGRVKVDDRITETTLGDDIHPSMTLRRVCVYRLHNLKLGAMDGDEFP